jgi:choline dehydrogenase-like flavoprotein
MGDNPAKSITDANGRFHHVVNAYCIDQVLFPTIGRVNSDAQIAEYIATLK